MLLLVHRLPYNDYFHHLNISIQSIHYLNHIKLKNVQFFPISLRKIATYTPTLDTKGTHYSLHFNYPPSFEKWCCVFIKRYEP